MAKRLAVELFVMLLVGAVLGAFGPFGTFETEAGPRFAFWILCLLVGYACFRPMVAVGYWFAEALGVHPIVGNGLALTLASVPMTFFVSLSLSGFDMRAALTDPSLALRYVQVWLIGFLVNGLFHLLYRGEKGPEAELVAAPDRSAEPSAAFRDSLPIGFGPILALKGEDHYVRVIGEAREELVLARMRDAIAGLGGLEGMQVHRSWWVARAAIRSVRREGRTAILVLSNGSEVPVSRENMGPLKASGWVKQL